MKQTWKQFISDIQTSIRAVTVDDFIPPRYIFYEAQNIVADFLKKDNDAKKKLSKISEGWTDLDCIELEEIDVVQCSEIDVRLCDKVMKSVNRLPDTYTYSFGNIIKHVASVNFAYFFDPVTPREWNNKQKRKYKDKNKYYYYLIDNYLYIPVPKGIDLPIQVVRMEAYFMDKYEVEKFKLLKTCESCKEQPVLCTSPLDYEIVIPTYLISDVKKELLNKLNNSFLRLFSDQYPNMNNSPEDKTSKKDIQIFGS